MHRQGMQEYAEHVRKREEVLQGGGLIWGSQIVCQQCGNSDSSWCCDCPPMVNWGDRGEVLAEVVKDGQALRHATDELKADREFILAAVAHGFALEHVSAELKADREVVLAAVGQYGPALMHVSDELKADQEVVLAIYHDYSITITFVHVCPSPVLYQPVVFFLCATNM